MFKVIIVLIGVAESVLGLKCHICDNFDSGLCFQIANAKGKFLKECTNNASRCALLVEKSIDPHTVRSCVTPGWSCDLSKFNCKTCNSDGCNIGTEVEKDLELPEVEIMVMSNIYGVGIILLLISVIIIWCLIRKCSKKKDPVYEDDCDEYYENETNIDLE